MKNKLLTLLFLIGSASLVFGQGACSPDKIALLDTGRPSNSATIRVCTAGSTGVPCTPTASLFTDPTLGTPLGGSPVVTADARGNWGFCAAAATNYDYQITCAGCTTLTVKNFPLPPTTPIAAASLTSATANPATVGTIKLASTDIVDWRNNANTGNTQLAKTGAAAGNVPADTLDMTAFGGARASSFISATANPSSAGAVALASTDCAKFRNNANAADVNGLCKNASDQVLVGSGPVIVPAVSDTAALLAAAQTLLAKTLTSPVITNPSTTGTDSGAEILQNKTLQSPVITTGVGQGSGYKHQRFGSLCTTAVGANSSCSSTLTWTSAFADANYTAVCQGDTNTGSLAFLIQNGHAAGTVTVTISNSSGGGAVSFTNVNCTGTHD